MEKIIYKGQEVKSGNWFSCKIGTMQTEGRVYFSELDNRWYLMQNKIKGTPPPEGLQYGYTFSFLLSITSAFSEHKAINYGITDLIITPYTDKKDFKWGDKVEVTDDDFIYTFACIHPFDEKMCVLFEDDAVEPPLAPYIVNLKEVSLYQPNTHTLPDGRVIDLDTLEEKNFIK